MPKRTPVVKPIAKAAPKTVRETARQSTLLETMLQQSVNSVAAFRGQAKHLTRKQIDIALDEMVLRAEALRKRFHS